MRKYLYIIIILGLILGGCSVNKEDTIISNQIGSEISGQNIKEAIKRESIPLEGNIKQGLIFSGDNNFITLSGNLLNFSNDFSILLPKDLESWEYEYPIFTKEGRIIFEENSMKRTYTIDQEVLDWIQQNQDIKRSCKITNIKEEGVLTKKNIDKKFSTKESYYITSRTFELAGPDIIKPEKWIETTICFQVKNHIYNIHIGGYSNQELKKITESLKLINRGSEYIISGSISKQQNLGSNIYFSGNVFIYDKIFSFNLPKDISNWKYQVNSQGGDMMLYTGGNNKAIQVSTIAVPDNYVSMDTSNKCGMLYNSYTEESKYNGNLILLKDMYDVISDETLIPLKNRTTLCLADNQYIYGIALINIEQNELDDIINSFKFFK